MTTREFRLLLVGISIVVGFALGILFTNMEPKSDPAVTCVHCGAIYD